MRPNQHRNTRGGKRHFDRNRRETGPRRPDNNEPRQMNSLKEADVGISEFVGSTPTFNGVIKAKFSDFQVNEIDLDGNVVSLTDLTVPEPPADTEAALIIEGTDPELEGLVTAEQWKSITTMVDTRDRDTDIRIDVTELSKEDRTKIHVIVKSRFGQSVASSTVEEDELKFIKCSLYNKKVNSDVRTKWTWPGEYLYFVLHKFNLDTMKACNALAQQLNAKPSVLAYAGTKDKRANTSQWVCIKKRDPKQIARAVQRLQNMYVGNFTFKPETLKLGQLRGNRFKIALRQITVDKEIVEESLNSIKEKGFINYFGLQRFGNSAEIPTYAVGKALLQGKWSLAVELILKPREGDLDFMKRMREFWWTTRNAHGARNMLLKTNDSIEAKLLFGLAKHDGNDFVNALENIPRNMRLLYMHAYQSLIWNKAASKRVKLGLNPIVGDLVFVDKEMAVVDSVIDVIVEDPEEESATEEPSPEEKNAVDFKALVKPLTQADIDGGSYTLFDVVLPLPGHDITYPANELGAYYEELLAEDGLSSEKLKQRNKTYSLTGAYRKLLEKPEDLKWQFVKYNSDQDMLLNTDFELIKKDRIIRHSEDGPLTACLLEFSLNSSTYATMALREVLKVDTSTQHQIKLAKEETATVDEPPQKKNLMVIQPRE